MKLPERIKSLDKRAFLCIKKCKFKINFLFSQTQLQDITLIWVSLAAVSSCAVFH